jgi:hypothetical protein
VFTLFIHIYIHDSGIYRIENFLPFISFLLDVFSKFTDKEGNVKVIITVTVIIGVIFIGICTYLLWSCMAKQKGNMHLPDPFSSLLSSLKLFSLITTYTNNK